MFRNLVYRTTCLVCMLALALSFTASAYADVRGTDNVGSTTITDRGLTVAEAPIIGAAYGVLCDVDGNVLWARGADQQAPMASITKVMTAVVAMENGKDDDAVTVSAKAASVGESSAGLRQGEKVTLRNLLYGLLVHSGNDAAVAVAECISGSEDKFVEAMNAKAAELGLHGTHFANPHGLPADDHYSTAGDLSVLIRYAMHKKQFRKIVKLSKTRVDYGGRKVTLKNTNTLLRVWDECIGVKTGVTDKAGYCLASAARRDGLELYAVVLGCSDEAERFIDSYKLYDWGFAHYRSYTLAKAGDVLVDVPMSGFLDKTVPAGVAEDVASYVLDYDGDVSVDIRLVDLPDGVREGERVGSVVWRQGEKLVANAELVAKESRGGPWPITAVWTSLCRLVGVATGDRGVAEATLHAASIEVERDTSRAGDRIAPKLERKIRADARAMLDG